MREHLPMILAIGPTPGMARAALEASGLSPDGGMRIRMVTRYTGLRGWSHGMPVVAHEVDRWGELAGMEGRLLAHTLLTLINCGRLRLAQEADLARLKEETVQ
jgi:hypothetical protein